MLGPQRVVLTASPAFPSSAHKSQDTAFIIFLQTEDKTSGIDLHWAHPHTELSLMPESCWRSVAAMLDHVARWKDDAYFRIYTRYAQGLTTPEVTTCRGALSFAPS